MVILFGAIATILTQFVKWLSGKIGVELTKAWVLLALFVICVFWAFVEKYLVSLNVGFLENLVGTYAVAIAAYETLLKNIWTPILNKLKK